MQVFYHEDCLAYAAPAGLFDHGHSPYLARQIEQPEGPDRILNTRGVLENSPLNPLLDWREPVAASDEELLLFHTRDYIDSLIAAETEAQYVTSSTYMVQGGMHMVRLSAGCCLGAARAVLSGEHTLGYALSRPPGHHAAPAVADGYCFVNGVGLIACEALANGARRVATIDWDVHHGNGTQAGFYERDDVLTISIHMDHGSWGPTHPESGDVDEIGIGAGEGFNLNLPLPFGSGDLSYNLLFEQCIAPRVKAFDPDLIVLANGQDANMFDPNGRQCVTMAGYHRLATQLRELAADVCGGKIVATQEGGYNPSYAPYCAYAVAAGLLGQELEIADPIAIYPDPADRARRDVAELVARHPLLEGGAG